EIERAGIPLLVGDVVVAEVAGEGAGIAVERGPQRLAAAVLRAALRQPREDARQGAAERGHRLELLPGVVPAEPLVAVDGAGGLVARVLAIERLGEAAGVHLVAAAA